MTSHLFPPSTTPSLPIHGQKERFPVHRIFCVGCYPRAHTIEMGRPVDKSVAACGNGL